MLYFYIKAQSVISIWNNMDLFIWKEWWEFSKSPANSLKYLTFMGHGIYEGGHYVEWWNWEADEGSTSGELYLWWLTSFQKLFVNSY